MLDLIIYFFLGWTLYSLGFALHGHFFSKDFKFPAYCWNATIHIFVLWMLLPFIYVAIAVKKTLKFIGVVED